MPSAFKLRRYAPTDDACPVMLSASTARLVGGAAALGAVPPARLATGHHRGEVAEFRRKDFGPGCETVMVSRAVNHRSGTCTIDTTKSGKTRTVVIPPHIRAEIKAHLDTHTKAGADALLFVPARGGCH